MQTENDTSKPETELKEEAGEGCSGASCSVLWLSLPDEPEDQDAPLLVALTTGDAYTTDMRQAARLAGIGYTVKRRDRHVDGHLVKTTLSAEVLDLSIDQGFEMRGARELNRPNAEVCQPEGEKTQPKKTDV